MRKKTQPKKRMKDRHAVTHNKARKKFAVRAEAPGLRIEVGPELRAASLPPVRLADGAMAWFLREGSRQNLVYAVQALPEAGAGAPEVRLLHALTR